jgi:Spondin-like TSP1 domain
MRVIIGLSVLVFAQLVAAEYNTHFMTLGVGTAIAGPPDAQDCVLKEWSTWSNCQPNTGNCGAGKQTRTRDIQTQPTNHGAECPPVNLRTETQECMVQCQTTPTATGTATGTGSAPSATGTGGAATTSTGSSCNARLSSPRMVSPVLVPSAKPCASASASASADKAPRFLERMVRRGNPQKHLGPPPKGLKGEHLKNTRNPHGDIGEDKHDVGTDGSVVTEAVGIVKQRDDKNYGKEEHDKVEGRVIATASTESIRENEPAGEDHAIPVDISQHEPAKFVKEIGKQ